jgi:Tfp pilus assembly protein PilE
MKGIKKNESGTTMIEMIIYVVLLSIMSGVIVMFMINILDAYRRVNSVALMESNAKQVMRAFENEAKFARSIYGPTSVFGVATSQVSFETNFNLPPGETYTYVDFYLDNQKIYEKREGQDPLAITADNISVSNFMATQLGTTSVRIMMTVEPRFQKSLIAEGKSFIFSTALRGAY